MESRSVVRSPRGSGKKCHARWLGVVAAIAALAACSSGGGGDPAPAPTYAISGTVTGASVVTVRLGGAGTASTVTDANGRYTFTGLANGTYTVTPAKLAHTLSPAIREVVVSGADQVGRDFATTALASYDPLTADTLDAGRWQTPEFVRTISGGKAHLSVRAEGMESNLAHGTTYTSALTVAGAAGRVTTFQADVGVPAASASRTGTATIYGGLRLYYQAAARRGLSFPGALQDELIAALELYDSGSGLRVRRRFGHCDDAACVSVGASGITFGDPGGFTPSGVNAWAAAAYDTTYTLTLALNEATGVFTWTVRGGAFGSPGVSGTADASVWASSAGVTFASATDGFLSAQLHARASDASAAGGGSGALTAAFDNVMVGTNGASATLHDDFATVGSGEATGFSADRWRADSNGAVRPSGEGVHLTSSILPSGTTASTLLAAGYPASFSAWQADLAIVRDGPGSNAVELGGQFVRGGTGAANDATGDIFCYVTLGAAGASARVGQCLDATCTASSILVQAPLPAAPGHPYAVGTVHTVLQQWDAASTTFVVRMDDGAPVALKLPATIVSLTPPRVPSRVIRARAVIPAGAADAARTVPTSVEAVVKDVRVTP